MLMIKFVVLTSCCYLNVSSNYMFLLQYWRWNNEIKVVDILRFELSLSTKVNGITWEFIQRMFYIRRGISSKINNTLHMKSVMGLGSSWVEWCDGFTFSLLQKPSQHNGYCLLLCIQEVISSILGLQACNH